VIIGPALVLSVIVGLFHVSAYVFIRGRAGARLPLLVIASILGAWAGDTVAVRMAIDPLRIGEYHLLTASFVAWLGIGLVAVLAGLVPERPAAAARPSVSTAVTRSRAIADDASEDDRTATTRAPASGDATPQPLAPR
jgi:hypothetical protein